METRVKTRVATAVAVAIFMVMGVFSAKAQLLFRDNHLFVGPRPANYTSVACCFPGSLYRS